jgi:hypothetical protein
MKQGLQLDFEWLASGPVDSPARVGLAALSIWVNGKPATNRGRLSRYELAQG